MKKAALILALLLCATFIPTSCTKDKTDPNIPKNLYGTWYGEGGMYSYSVTFLKDKTCVIMGASSQTYMLGFQDAWTMDCPYTYDNGHITCTGTLYKTLGATGQTLEIDNYSTTFDYHETYLTGGMEPAITQYTKD